MSRNVGEPPTLCDRRPGFFNDRIQSGPRFNVSSEGRNSQLYGVPTTVTGTCLLQSPEDRVLPAGQQHHFQNLSIMSPEPYPCSYAAGLPAEKRRSCCLTGPGFIPGPPDNPSQASTRHARLPRSQNSTVCSLQSLCVLFWFLLYYFGPTTTPPHRRTSLFLYIKIMTPGKHGSMFYKMKLPNKNQINQSIGSQSQDAHSDGEAVCKAVACFNNEIAK